MQFPGNDANVKAACSPFPLAVTDVPAPVPPEEVISGWQAARAIRARAGETLWDLGVGVWGAAGSTAAGEGCVGGWGVAGPALCWAAVGHGVQGRRWAVGQGGEWGQLGSGAAVGQRVGQISWARGCCSLQGREMRKVGFGLECRLGDAAGQLGLLQCCPLRGSGCTEGELALGGWPGFSWDSWDILHIALCDAMFWL